jgi:hypothetical protein
VRTFGEKPEWPLFYTAEELIAANESWLTETDDIYFGQPSKVNPPGDIDRVRSLLIGELGPDQLVALDYRGDAANPRVVYAANDLPCIWHHVADSVEELLEGLRW